jgi:hypothetical protein
MQDWDRSMATPASVSPNTFELLLKLLDLSNKDWQKHRKEDVKPVPNVYIP